MIVLNDREVEILNDALEIGDMYVSNAGWTRSRDAEDMVLKQAISLLGSKKSETAGTDLQIATELQEESERDEWFRDTSTITWSRIERAMLGVTTNPVTNDSAQEASEGERKRCAELEKALRVCVSALYEAFEIAPLDRLPSKAGDAIQQAQWALETFTPRADIAGKEE